MQTRSDQARELVMTLASRGKTDGTILRKLRKAGLDGVISHSQIEHLIREASIARKCKRGSSAHRLFRTFGYLLALGGFIAIFLGPNKFSLSAIVFGLILAFHPEGAHDDSGMIGY